MEKQNIDRDTFYNEILRIYKIEGKININIFYKYTDIKCDYIYYIHKFGGIKSICKDLGIDYLYYNQMSKDDVKKKAKNLYSELGYINKDVCTKNQISSSTVRRYFGNYNTLFKEIGASIKMPRFVTEEEVKEDIIKFYNEYNSTSSTLYRRLGKYSSTIINRLGGWRSLLKDIGIKPMFENLGKDYMVESARKIYEEYGFISKDLINDNCEFTYQALSSYFKDKKEMSLEIGNTLDIFENGKRSKNEKVISKYLDEIIGRDNYITEMTWSWLKNKYTNCNMYCDFYIPKLNIVIEYNGEQHYKYIERFHRNQNGFINMLDRDNQKYKLLNDNGIKLIILKYDEKLTKDLILNIINN